MTDLEMDAEMERRIARLSNPAVEELTRNELLNILAKEVAARQRAEKDRDTYRNAIVYVLDGYGLDAPFYEEDPDDPVEQQDRWITDHLRSIVGEKRPSP